MPWKCQESCIRTQCFTKNVLDIVSTRLCFIHELWERVGMNSPHTNSHPQSPHFRFEKQIETGQTWCFCTKKKIDWAEATAKAYKWRLWNTGFWLAESIWSQPMALALRFAANPFLKFRANPHTHQVREELIERETTKTFRTLGIFLLISCLASQTLKKWCGWVSDVR